MDTVIARPAPAPLRGVNLGNWLLLERWMSPRVFEGVVASDEYSLCSALGPEAERRILRHRDSFITEADFRWLAMRGINAVRVPFGYWLIEEDGPYVSSAAHLDRAVALAEEHGLKVVLDLHGLPGAQGPHDHTGRAGYFKWHTDRRYIERSLDVIERVAQRYAASDAVVGFSIINEPDPSIGRAVLVPFFEDAYDRVRRHMPAERVAVVIPAYPEGELPVYHGALGARANVWTDVHLYQNFGDCWDDWRLDDYLAYPLERQGRLRKHLERGPVMVGEWSMCLAPALLKQIEAMPAFRRQTVLQMHGRMLLATLEEYDGWFFWSYRVEGRPDWSFRDCVERGWLPEYFGDAPPRRAARAAMPLRRAVSQVVHAGS
jgi:glucan 1,3-beta-glucosidase